MQGGTTGSGQRGRGRGLLGMALLWLLALLVAAIAPLAASPARASLTRFEHEYERVWETRCSDGLELVCGLTGRWRVEVWLRRR